MNNLDKYSIFDLMGLNDLNESQQESMLLEINDMVWLRFASEKLQHILTSEQFNQINKMLNDNISFSEIVTQITKFSPNFPLLIADFTREFKKNFVVEHFQARLSECERELEINTSKPKFEELMKNREIYIRSIELASADYWDLLVELNSKKD